jgi:ribosomal protein S18 acetylase RimI-like enzyme
MKSNIDKQIEINILPPESAGEKLLFRVFDKGSPIGYARLKKISQPKLKPINVIDMFDPDGFNVYELKMIEISQNYRHQEVGTNLLQEIISYCKKSNIKRLTGEIKGDARTLRHWYRNNGFTITHDDRINLHPAIYA